MCGKIQSLIFKFFPRYSEICTLLLKSISTVPQLITVSGREPCSAHVVTHAAVQVAHHPLVLTHIHLSFISEVQKILNERLILRATVLVWKIYLNMLHNNTSWVWKIRGETSFLNCDSEALGRMFLHAVICSSKTLVCGCENAVQKGHSRVLGATALACWLMAVHLRTLQHVFWRNWGVVHCCTGKGLKWPIFLVDTQPLECAIFENPFNSSFF